MKNLFLTILAVFTLTGCITIGKDFKVRGESSFILGKTTKKEITVMYGEPKFEEPFGDKGITLSTYLYVRKGLVKGQSLYFDDGILVGYDTTSTFPEINTYFDHTQSKKIEIHKTNKSEVWSMIGRPSGKHIFPMAPTITTHNETYSYDKVTPGRVLYTHNIIDLYLVVTYNSDNVVVNVEEKYKIVNN